MRLRYLRLAHYPPLSDLTVDFSKRAPWSIFDGRDAAPACAVHFVIGLNGTGKSHLLRALAATFLALADQRLPGFPVSLIYEMGRPDKKDHRTVIFDCPGEKHATSLWVAEEWNFPDAAERGTFGAAIEFLRTTEGARAEFGGAVFMARIARGAYPQAAPYALPRAVLAYTSGALAPWREVWQPPASGEGLDLGTQDENYDSSRERPPGWTMEDEVRLALDDRTPGGRPSASQREQDSPGEDLFRRPILLEGVHLAGALLAVALHEAQRVWSGEAPDERLARLFAMAGWRRLVGVRLRLNLDRALQQPRERRALLDTLHDALLAAGEVISEPHPTEAWRSLYFDLEGPLAREGSTYSTIDPTTLTRQGQALHALLGEKGDSAFARFGALLNWSKYGLLDDVELFIRRSDKATDEASEAVHDVGVLRLSELSDGERQVLARWALFHLLTGQDDSLLLLDEPETHFNDRWKREIIDVVEDAMGGDRSAVLVATHSSIVLSDVFHEEVVLIRNIDGKSIATAVTDRTFATDPSALMMTVFSAEDSIGRRAQRRIKEFMSRAAAKSDPSVDDVRQLQALIRRLGSGFYRTELQTLLNEWQQAPHLRAVAEATPARPVDTLADELRALIRKQRQAGAAPTERGDA